MAAPVPRAIDVVITVAMLIFAVIVPVDSSPRRTTSLRRDTTGMIMVAEWGVSPRQ